MARNSQPWQDKMSSVYNAQSPLPWYAEMLDFLGRSVLCRTLGYNTVLPGCHADGLVSWEQAFCEDAAWMRASHPLSWTSLGLLRNVYWVPKAHCPQGLWLHWVVKSLLHPTVYTAGIQFMCLISFQLHFTVVLPVSAIFCGKTPITPAVTESAAQNAQEQVLS